MRLPGDGESPLCFHTALIQHQETLIHNRSSRDVLEGRERGMEGEEWACRTGLSLNISPQTNLRLENGGFGMMRETSPSKAQAFSGEVTPGKEKESGT